MDLFRKHNVGRVREQKWILGGIDRDTSMHIKISTYINAPSIILNIFKEEIFLCPCPSRDMPTLHRLIQQYVKPGTHIITDCWASYNGLDQIGYQVAYIIIY